MLNSGVDLKFRIKVAAAVSAVFALSAALISGTTASADPASDLADTQRALRQCQLELQYATTQAEKDAANACITIKNKIIAGLTATPTPTTSPTVSPTPTISPTVSPTGTTWPNASNVGVPSGTSFTTLTEDLVITQPGVYENVKLIGADIQVRANNVVLRKMLLQGGVIDNEENRRCYNGLVIEDTTIEQTPTGYTNAGNNGVIGPGGYTARRVKIVNRVEGFRVGGKSDAGCGDVLIENSYAYVTPPRPCGDWHGDTLQGYDAPAVIVRNSVMILNEDGCDGNAPFYYVGETGNTRVDVNGLIVQGGGYPFRLGAPATVRGLHIVNNSWYYGPISVRCNRVTVWQADIVTLNSAGQIASTVRTQPCNTSSS